MIIRGESSRALGWLLVCLVSSCGGGGGGGGGTVDAGGSQPDAAGMSSVTVTIDATGGQLAVGGVTVTVPAGALTTSTALTLSIVSAPAATLPNGFTRGTPFVALQPFHLTFAVAVTISLPEGATKPRAHSVNAGGAIDTSLSIPDTAATAFLPNGTATDMGGHAVSTTLTTGIIVDGTGAIVAASCTPACPGTQICVEGTTCQDPVTNACGAALGYEPNSPYPTVGGCNARTGRTSATGPATMPTVQTKEFIPAGGEFFVGYPVVTALGDLYVSTTKSLVKLDPDLTPRWTVDADGGGSMVVSAPIILANGDAVVCSASGLRRFDAVTGHTVWNAANTDAQCVTNSSHTAVPWIDPIDGTIVVAGTDFVTHVDATSGHTVGAKTSLNGGCLIAAAVDDAGDFYCDTNTYHRDGSSKWSPLLNNGLPVQLVTHGGKAAVNMGGLSKNMSVYEVHVYPLTGVPVIATPPPLFQTDNSIDRLDTGTFPPDPVAVDKDGHHIYLHEFGGTGSAGVEQIDLDSATNVIPPTTSPCFVGGPPPPCQPLASPKAVATKSWATPNAPPLSAKLHDQPILDPNGVLFYGSVDGKVIALDTTTSGMTGVVLWQATVLAVGAASSPVIGIEHRIYVIAGGSISQRLYQLK